MHKCTRGHNIDSGLVPLSQCYVCVHGRTGLGAGAGGTAGTLSRAVRAAPSNGLKSSSPRPAYIYHLSNRSGVGESPTKGKRRNAIPFPSIGLMILVHMLDLIWYESLVHVPLILIDYVYMYAAGRGSELHAVGPAGARPVHCLAGGQDTCSTRPTNNMTTSSPRACLNSTLEHSFVV